MANIKLYVFDFESVRIQISALTIRRRQGSKAFCSVTVPDPEPYTDLFSANPLGTLVISQTLDGGAETVVGTFTLSQVLTTKSTSVFTIVLNGEADFGTDQSTQGITWDISSPITSTDDSTGTQRFSAAENALIVVDDTILFNDTTSSVNAVLVNVEEISLFVNSANSRMDVGVS